MNNNYLFIYLFIYLFYFILFFFFDEGGEEYYIKPDDVTYTQADCFCPNGANKPVDRGVHLQYIGVPD